MSLATAESAILDASVDAAWAAIRPLDFAWSSEVSNRSDGDPAVGATRTVRRYDGVVETIRVLEISDIKQRVAYEVVSRVPAAGYTSARSTITLRRVTETDQTFIEWETAYGNDGGTIPSTVVEGSSREKLQAFQDLGAALSGGAGLVPEPEQFGGVLDIRGDREMVSTVERAEELFAPILKGKNFGITEVMLSTKSLGDDAAKVVARALSQLPNLTTADIDDIIAGRMDAEALRVMSTVVESLVGKPLVQLNASDNAFGPRGVVACKPALVSALDTLERVYFCNNGLSSEAGKILCDILLAKGPSKLKLLHVHNNMLGEGGAKEISPFIEQCPTLEDFRFTTTRVPEAGGVALSTALGCST